MNAVAERIDVAVLDFGGRLASEVCGALEERLRTESSTLVVDRGRWLERAVAVARPPRVTAAVAPGIAELVAAAVSGCRPRLLVLLGPGAAVSAGLSVGQALTVGGATDAVSGERLKVDTASDQPAEVAQGVVDAGDTRFEATTSWVYEAAASAAAAGQAFVPLVAVTRSSNSGAPTRPPRWREPTVARSAGAWLGSMLAGRKQPTTGADRRVQSAVAAELRELIGSLP